MVVFVEGPIGPFHLARDLLAVSPGELMPVRNPVRQGDGRCIIDVTVRDNAAHDLWFRGAYPRPPLAPPSTQPLWLSYINSYVRRALARVCVHVLACTYRCAYVEE